jgi:hypothetical protein
MFKGVSSCQNKLSKCLLLEKMVEIYFYNEQNTLIQKTTTTI